ncbi:MAG: hypothetical protein SFU83_18290 [Meiothermus sp.]|nr:hypothetical protein [Meiothermus sp.]
MYSTQTKVTTAQALNHLAEMTSKEAAELPEGLTFAQLRNLLEALEGAEFIVARLKRAAELHMSYIEEAGEDYSPLVLELPSDFVPAA